MSGEESIEKEPLSDDQIKRAIIHGGSMALQELLSAQSHTGELARAQTTEAQVRRAEASLLTALEVGIAARSQQTSEPDLPSET